MPGTSDWWGQISPELIQCLRWCKTGWAACNPGLKTEKLKYWKTEYFVNPLETGVDPTRTHTHTHTHPHIHIHIVIYIYRYRENKSNQSKPHIASSSTTITPTTTITTTPAAAAARSISGSLCHPWFTTTSLSYSFLFWKLPPPPCAVLLVSIAIFPISCTGVGVINQLS